jgi:hypothetical protein
VKRKKKRIMQFSEGLADDGDDAHSNREEERNLQKKQEMEDVVAEVVQRCGQIFFSEKRPLSSSSLAFSASATLSPNTPAGRPYVSSNFSRMSGSSHSIGSCSGEFHSIRYALATASSSGRSSCGTTLASAVHQVQATVPDALSPTRLN